MKVLTHKGVLLTVPFTSAKLERHQFERIDGEGGADVGVVAEMSDAAVRALVNAAGDNDQAFATPRQIMNNVRFIAGRLIEIPLGTEVKAQSDGGRFKLLIPDDARPKKEPVNQGDRVAINEKVRHTAWMNTHGTVETIEGDKATVKLDDGDRTRVMRLTGKQESATATLPVYLLDKLDDAK